MSNNLANNEELKGVFKTNQARDVVKIKFNQIFSEELLKMFNNNQKLYEKLDSNRELKEFVNDKIFEYVNQKVR